MPPRLPTVWRRFVWPSAEPPSLEWGLSAPGPDTLLNENNQPQSFQNPWQFDPTGTPGQKWSLHANTNNYLFHVIYDEYEGHAGTQE
jgi:hypothetical protein